MNHLGILGKGENPLVLAFGFFQWVNQYGYWGIFSALMLGIFGVPFPDEVLLLFVGYLIYKQKLLVIPAILSAFAGSAVGITMSYALGRTGGLFIIEKFGKVLHLAPAKFEKVHNWLRTKSKWALLLGYFVPGLRHAGAFIAGTSELEFRIFAVYAYLGGLVWVIFFIAAGFLLGRGWTKLARAVQQGSRISIGLLAAAGIIYYIIRKIRKTSVSTNKK